MSLKDSSNIYLYYLDNIISRKNIKIVNIGTLTSLHTSNKMIKNT